MNVCMNFHMYFCMYVGCGPFPVTVTTRTITFLVGNPYIFFTYILGMAPSHCYWEGATPNINVNMFITMCVYKCICVFRFMYAYMKIFAYMRLCLCLHVYMKICKYVN